MKFSSISPNMLETFALCERKFNFKYIQKMVLPNNPAMFEKGKKIHALANYFLRSQDVSKMELVLSEDEKLDWMKLKSNKYLGYDVFNTEYNLNCNLRGYWIGGRLDALMHKNSDFVILDYKTGQIPKNPQESFQTAVYLLCADKFLQKKGGYDSLKFVYIGLKNNDEQEIIFSNDLKSKFEEKIISACKNIEKAQRLGKFLKNCKECKFCEYNKVCDCED